MQLFSGVKSNTAHLELMVLLLQAMSDQSVILHSIVQNLSNTVTSVKTACEPKQQILYALCGGMKGLSVFTSVKQKEIRGKGEGWGKNYYMTNR